MAMTPFEKAVINELQGIKKELHELNKKKPEQGQVDGVAMDASMDFEGFIDEMNRMKNRNQRFSNE